MNAVLLEEKMESSGLKYSFIAEQLGISPQGFIKKRKGQIPFTIKEVGIIKSLLGLTNSERDKIFFE